MSEPTVSIGIVVASPLTGVERAVRSALAQSYERLEILLWDGIVSQETIALTDRLSALDERIEVRRDRSKLGVIDSSAAVRTAASGDYFMWLDSRSWIDPRYVSVAVDYLQRNGAHSMVNGSASVHRADGSVTAVAPTPVGFEDSARRVEALMSNIGGIDAWYGLYRFQAISDVPLHQGLGFEYACLASVAWRGKIGAEADMLVHREESGDESGVSGEVSRLGLANFQSTDPWLAVATVLFCNIAFFDPAFARVSLLERIRLAVAAADAVAHRWKVHDEGMLISFASRMFAGDDILARFRTVRTTMVDVVLALAHTAGTDPHVQNLIGIVNVLCRMRIGNIPMTDEDRDIVRQLENIWDHDKSLESQNKVAIISAMYV